MICEMGKRRKIRKWSTKGSLNDWTQFCSSICLKIKLPPYQNQNTLTLVEGYACTPPLPMELQLCNPLGQ